MTPQEVRAAVASLRTVGGVYEYVAACVEHDNLPPDPPLTDTEVSVLARFGVAREYLTPTMENTMTNQNTPEGRTARDGNASAPVLAPDVFGREEHEGPEQGLSDHAEQGQPADGEEHAPVDGEVRDHHQNGDRGRCPRSEQQQDHDERVEQSEQGPEASHDDREPGVGVEPTGYEIDRVGDRPYGEADNPYSNDQSGSRGDLHAAIVFAAEVEPVGHAATAPAHPAGEQHEAERDAGVPIIEAAARFTTPDELTRLVVVMMTAWGENHPESSVAKYPTPYVATFVDMARAVLASRAKPVAPAATAPGDREKLIADAEAWLNSSTSSVAGGRGAVRKLLATLAALVKIDEAKLAEVIWAEQESRVLNGYVIHTRETARTTAAVVIAHLRGEVR